jgi:hypothetical protein
MLRKLSPVLVILAMALTFGLLGTACGGSASAPAKTTGLQASQAVAKKNISAAYVQKNALDFRNYNSKQQITDDPSTIMWCTLYPGTIGQEPVTYAFAGKVTSSTKTPYPPYNYDDRGNYTFTQEPVAGPDGMYGSSDSYEFGLDPSGQILTQFSIPYVCSTQPTTYQANSTKIVSAVDPSLLALSQQASALIKKAEKEKGAVKLRDLTKASVLLKSSSKAAGQ